MLMALRDVFSMIFLIELIVHHLQEPAASNFHAPAQALLRARILLKIFVAIMKAEIYAESAFI